MNKKKGDPADFSEATGSAAHSLQSASFGVLDSSFLCQSVSCLNPPTPLCVAQDDSIDAVMSAFQRHRHGCAMVLDPTGRLIGIFSERDFVLKIFGNPVDTAKTPVVEFMTREPITQTPTASIASLLNLMSHGGFRHIPIVDSEQTPIWLISVKNIIDYLAQGVSDALLNFKTLDDNQ